MKRKSYIYAKVLTILNVDIQEKIDDLSVK